MKRLFLLMVIALLAVMPTSLQEDCSAASLTEAVQVQLDVMDEDPVPVLTEIIRLATQGISACSESYSFSDDGGFPRVLGPISLSEGFYMFTMTTNGAGRVSPTALSENCGSDLSSTIINISKGAGARGAESLVTVEADCDVFLQLSNLTVAEAWTLEVAKVY